MRSKRVVGFAAAAAVGIVLLAGGAIFALGRMPCETLTGPTVCRAETSERVVALTFDDGPTARGLDAVLPVLRDRNVKATFFLVGSQMAENPGLAERLKAEGHELGNHSWSHERMMGRSAAFYDAEIARTDARLRAAGEVRPTLFRPPYGKRLWGLSAAVERAGYRTVTWDVAPDGVDHESPEAYARYVLDRVRPGSIILIHPMYRANETARRALPAVLDGLAARGYRVVPAGELLASADRG